MTLSFTPLRAPKLRELARNGPRVLAAGAHSPRGGRRGDWAGQRPRACPKRRLPADVVFPAFALVLAGRRQGGVPRPGQHRVAIRDGGAQPELRDAADRKSVV